MGAVFAVAEVVAPVPRIIAAVIAKEEVAELVWVETSLSRIKEPLDGAFLDGLALVIFCFQIESDTFVSGFGLWNLGNDFVGIAAELLHVEAVLENPIAICDPAISLGMCGIFWENQFDSETSHGLRRQTESVVERAVSRKRDFFFEQNP